MREIYKYPIDINGGQVDVHEGAETLSVGVQHNRLVCWALVPQPAIRVVERRLAVYLTGDETSGEGRFLGTHSLDDGTFILHVWDDGEETP